MFSFLSATTLAVGDRSEKMTNVLVFVSFATVLITASRQQPGMILKMRRVEDDVSETVL